MITVMHYVSKMDRAGQETFIMNLFRNIDRSQINFEFLCTLDGEGEYDSEILNLGGKINHIRLNRIRGKVKQLDNMRILNSYLAKRKNEIQVFHIHTQHAMDASLSAIAAKLARIKTVIVHSHNTNTIYSIPAHKGFKVLLNILPVEHFACSVAAGHWMFGKHKFHVIKNGIEVDKFRYDESIRNSVRNEYNWNEKLIIGHVGRFNEQKNHSYVIDIFKKVYEQIPTAELVLIGKGELMDKVKTKIQKYNLDKNVDILGTIDNVNKLYQGMDIFLFPSLFEGLPVVLVETQMSDLICLFSDTITKEIDFTDDMHRMSIDEQPEKWAEEVIRLARSQRIRGDTTNEISSNGYDIIIEAKKIQDFYYKASVG